MKVKDYYGDSTSLTNEVLNKSISVHQRDVYGVAKVYPICADAHWFAAIAGTTTLTQNALNNILKLGYEIIYT